MKVYRMTGVNARTNVAEIFNVLANNPDHAYKMVSMTHKRPLIIKVVRE